MYNDLFTLGKITIHGYGFMIAIGFFVAIGISLYRLKKANMDQEIALDVSLIAMFSGFLGAKILFVIVEFKSFLANPLSVLGSAGFVVYGGIILAVACIILYCKKKGIGFFVLGDLVLPQVSIAQAIGRIGCFLAGCCYGAETTSPLGVVFPAGSIAPAGVKLWPTQLFCTVGDLIIAGLLYLLTYVVKTKFADKCKPGIITAGYCILYGAGRFGLEFFRADSRGAVGFLSTSQFISIFIVIMGIVLTVLSLRKAKEEK